MKIKNPFKNIFKSRKVKNNEKMAEMQALTMMIGEFWQIHREVYIRRRTKYTLEDAWIKATKDAQEYMTRKYGDKWTEIQNSI